MKQPFSKPALTWEQQIDLLERRGMDIPNRNEAEFYLRHLNYYRLAGYSLPFESDHATHQFLPGTTFAGVLNLYVFDRELRLLVLDAIERVEVSARSRWAYEIAHRHGPHGFLDSTLARNQQRFHQNLQSLQEEAGRSDETFMKHFRGRYTEPLPPSWAVCEVMSLGQLSKWFTNLKPKRTRRATADAFGLDEQVFQSWLHHLTYVRNVCAHHSRVWDRDLRIVPELPKTKPASLSPQLVRGSRRSYNTLSILLYLLDLMSPAHHWRTRLLRLMSDHSIDRARMHFPGGWQEFPLWKVDTSAVATDP